jgi:hypothetical protein
MLGHIGRWGNWVQRMTWCEVMGGREDEPIRCNDAISERIDPLGFWLQLYFWDRRAVLLFLEFTSHVYC